MKKLRKVGSGFSLIELLVVIAIMALLIGLALPNYLGARERARDAKRKEEMQQLKTALRLYYNDYQTYPPSATCGANVSYISGCGPLVPPNKAPLACCPQAGCGVDFSVGPAAGTGCEVLYMKQFPSELGVTMLYSQTASGDDFCLRVTLDNKSDPDITTSQARCASSCGAGSSGQYYVCAD